MTGHSTAKRQASKPLIRWVSLWLALLAAWCLSAPESSWAADAIPGEDLCQAPIDTIRFTGNDVTKDPVLRRELPQQEGADCVLDDVIDGIQNLMDLGLFRQVSAEFNRTQAADLILTYRVTEKIFFLPVPRLSRTSDGELRVGAQLRWDNFLGRLHQFKLTSERRQEDDGQGRTGYVYRANYRVPRFFGSRYGMNLTTGIVRRNTELARDGVTYGEALRKSRQLEFQLSRWTNSVGGVSGLSYFAGFGFERRRYEVRSGDTGPYSDGLDVALTVGFEVQRVHQEVYRRLGHHYAASLRVGDAALGGDFRHKRLDLRGLWYLPLSRPQTNLNIQARLGISDTAPFGYRAYSIGGGELLRGMKSGSYSGDVQLILNLEYLSGFFAYPAWRWVVFMDLGNVFPTRKVKLSELELRGGLGVRWKLESLTNTDLRIDVAWDPDREKLTPYISTNLTF